MSANENIHNLKGYIHNVVTTLKFIKEDNLVNDQEIKRMIDLLISKESSIKKDIIKIESHLGVNNE